MFSESNLQIIRNKGSVLGRILIGLLFLMSGVGIIMGGPDNTAVYFTSLGVPLASLMVWVVVIIKIGAGAAVIIGKRVAEAAALLIVFTLIATLLGHMNDMIGALKNLAIVGGLLYLMAFGPGGMNIKANSGAGPTQM